MGLVVVSHSARLADGVVEVAAQMAPDVTVLAAGGSADGGVGTDFDAVSAAVGRADTGAGVVLLYDLGSAQMTAELAVEALADPGSAVVIDAPLVEGTVAAAVAAQNGADRAAVAEAATSADASPATEVAPVPRDEAAERTELTLRNDVGLHARPAALLVRSVAGLDTAVRVRRGDDEADGQSVLALMSLGARQGDRIEVSATGAQAAEAIRRISDLVERDFDE